jgi:hypothetical protein
MENFSLNDLAREFVVSVLTRGATIAQQLTELYDAFATSHKCKLAAEKWIDGTDESIDVSDFAMAIEEEAESRAESLLCDLRDELSGEEEYAASQLIDNANWTDYARDVVQSVAAQVEINMESYDDREWLDAMTRRIGSGDQDIDILKFAESLDLSEGWDWGEVAIKMEEGELTRSQIDRAITRSLR